MRTLLEQQYDALSAWLDAVAVQDHVDVPAGLGDWTVRELVAHLGLGIGLSRSVTATLPGAVPLAFGDDPVGGFRRSAATTRRCCPRR